MANINSFQVINYKGTGKPTLETISKNEPAGKARFSFNTLNTEIAYIQVKLTQLAASTELTLTISGVPTWAENQTEPVHFVIEDPATKGTELYQIKYNTITENGGELIPVEYSQAVEKIIIDLEVTGLNQETILQLGAGFSSIS